MKPIHEIMMMAAVSLIAAVSCGNAVAQNAVIELTSDGFNSKVYDTNAEGTEYLGTLPAIVDFSATWCGPCRNIAPILEELAVENKDKIVIYKVDVDKCRDIAQAFGITSIPALLFIPLEGKPSMTVGARSKARFQEDIDKILLGR